MTHIKKQTGRTVTITGAASGLGLELVRLFALITSGKRSHCSDGSMTGRFPLPFSGPSSSSKATMEAFADVYLTELKPFGIDFIMVQPGSLLTGGPAKTAAQLKQVSENMTVEQRKSIWKIF